MFDAPLSKTFCYSTATLNKQPFWGRPFVPAILQIYGVTPTHIPRSFLLAHLVAQTVPDRSEEALTQPHIVEVVVTMNVPKTTSNEDFINVEPTNAIGTVTLKTIPRPKSTTWDTIQGVAEEGLTIAKGLVPKKIIPDKWSWP